MGDNFSMDEGERGSLVMIQVHDIQPHLLRCDPVPNRPGLVPVHSPEVEDSCPRGSWKEAARSSLGGRLPAVSAGFYRCHKAGAHSHTGEA